MFTLQRYLDEINDTTALNLMIEYDGSYDLENFHRSIPGHSECFYCQQQQEQRL